jgi:hypothetical protein
MKADLAVGSEIVAASAIDARRTIAFLGDALRVYATPAMTPDTAVAAVRREAL